MKIKIFAALILFLALFLFSCEGESPRIFDYQDSLSQVTAEISENGERYEAVLYFQKDEEGKRGVRRIEYSYPESLSGLSFTLEGENITAEIGGVRIANSWFEKEKVFRYGALFSLSEEDIYEIGTDKKGRTTALGKDGDITFEITTKKDGAPEKIVYDTKNKSIELRIKEIKRD